MKILILEDDQNRISSFKRVLSAHQVTFTEKAEDCIRELRDNKFDCLFLDHDLGGEVYVDSGPGTGYEVAKWLEEHEDRQPNLIFLHSLNSVGVKNMKQALPKSRICPWAWTANSCPIHEWSRYE